MKLFVLLVVILLSDPISCQNGKYSTIKLQYNDGHPELIFADANADDSSSDPPTAAADSPPSAEQKSSTTQVCRTYRYRRCKAEEPEVRNTCNTYPESSEMYKNQPRYLFCTKAPFTAMIYVVIIQLDIESNWKRMRMHLKKCHHNYQYFLV
ncbi:hypothetical protein CRE_27928 [Caenorhabditis remanei]|uniref:Uncharacterized protein n=1 Tax=Caenorhabditis remanei TaxID=31234 RepID=E3NMB0_CAERE|nr:hypothetical protein CRE_27928 [Caenorhabditis remanei]